MKRLHKEWLVILRTMEYILFQLRIEKSLKQALIRTFGRKGSRYRIGDGPWINGSHYDLVRDVIFGKRG